MYDVIAHFIQDSDDHYDDAD